MSLTDYLKKAATAAVISSTLFMANNLYAAENPVKIEKKQNKELENKISKLEKYIKKSDTDADARYDLSELYQKKSEETKDKSLEKKAKDIFLKGIDIDMKKSPYDILKKCNNMTFIDFDKEGRWKKEYLKEVFQEDKKEKKPVLVMFYANNNHKGIDVNKRESIIFSRLYAKYNQKVNFICVENPGQTKEGIAMNNEMCRNADKKGAGPMGIFEDPEVRKEKRLPRIRGPPSIAMYSTYDIVQGETRKRNGGNIKLIDILFGGPKSEDWTYKWTKDLSRWWVGPNIFNKKTPDDDGKLYRMFNTGNYKFVENFKYFPDN